MSASLFNKSVLFWIKPANTKINTQRKEKLQGSDFMQKPKPKSSNVYFKIFASGKFFKRGGNWHILDTFCFTCPKLGALPPLNLHLFPSGKGSCVSVWDWVCLHVLQNTFSPQGSVNGKTVALAATIISIKRSCQACLIQSQCLISNKVVCAQCYASVRCGDDDWRPLYQLRTTQAPVLSWAQLQPQSPTLVLGHSSHPINIQQML